MYWKIMLLSSVLFAVSKPSSSVGVVGEDACLNWTFSDLSTAVSRAVRNPADNLSLMIFFTNSVSPSRLDPRVTYTGDLSRGILSFVLANVTLLDSGRYMFVQTSLLGDVDLGGQVLVVAESPNILGITSLSLPAVEGQKFKLNCSTESRSVPFDHNLTMYSDWKKNGMNITVGSKYGVSGTILTISNLGMNDSGAEFTCRAFEDQRRNSAESSEFVLNVLYGPDTGNIILSPSQISYERVESSSLTVNCSTDCFPNCQYRWTGPGGGNYGNTGVLSIPEIKRDQAGVFTCTASNPKITSKFATATISVTVFYGPDTGSITLSPNQTSYEGVESFPLYVNCSTDCYPYCQYRWTGPGVGNYGNTGMLSIPEINRNQTGLFTCTATSPKITSKSATTTISITVFYGPDTPLQIVPNNTSYRVVEGARIPDINCTSSCFPSCEFHWTGPVQFMTGVISLGIVSRSKRGNYTCMGHNPRTQTQTASHMVTVIVIYGPDTPVLIPSSKEYTLNESNIIHNIHCSTECFPGCTSYWYKEQTKVPGIQADMLALGDVYRNDSGTYTCQSKNIENNTTREIGIQLVVQYPPTISMESRNGSFIETGLMINCSAHGIPERYNYSLIHSSLFSGIKIRQLIDNEPVSTGVLVHWFRNPSFMDTGVYTCIVRNGILDCRDGSLVKNVSSTVWIRGPPTVTSSDRDFYADKGHTGRLVIEYYNSLLNANITWHKQRYQTLEKLESSEKYNIFVANALVTGKFYSVLIQQPGFIATLEIQNVTEDDFSSYQVHLENSAGNLSDFKLNLRPRGRPDVPKDVRIAPSNIATRSVHIEWVSGFHGGSNQTFVIEYKTQEDEGWTTYSHVVIGGMIQNKYYNIAIEDLHQNTLYFFKLYAWNVFGRSEYSTIINATTHAGSRKQALSENGASSVIIGSVLGTCIPVAFLVIVVVVLLCRRRRSYSDGKSSSQSKTCRSTTAEGTELECRNIRTTVAATGETHYANLHLDVQGTTGEINENLNIRSLDTITYDALHPYVNDEEHAYSSLNQRPQQIGENCVYENTKVPGWS